MPRRAAGCSRLGLLVVIVLRRGFSMPGPVRAATVSVAVENYDFAPPSRTVTAGDVVRWTFSGTSTR